jgi:MFS family permease
MTEPHQRRAFRGLVLGFGTSAIGFGAMTPFLVIWAHRDAGLAGSAAGLLFVAQAAGELSGGLGGGILADRLGGRGVLMVSAAGMALAYGSLGLITSPVLAVVTIYVAGLFEAAYHPTALALVGQITPESEHASAYGLIRAGANLGTILGPLAGAALVAGASVSDVFFLAAALLAGAGVVACLTLPRTGLAVDREEEVEEIQAAVPGLKAIRRDRRLGLLVLGGALATITLAWWEADGWAILHTQRIFGTSAFSLMLAFSAALTVAFQLPVSRLARGRSVPLQLGLGLALQACGLGLLAAASGGIGLVIAAVALLSLGQMVYSPQISALAARLAPRGAGATYQAAVSTTVDIGMAAGPASGLALSSALSGAALWLLAIPLCAGAGLATSRAAGRSGDADRTDGGAAASTAAPPARQVDDSRHDLVETQAGGVDLDGVMGRPQG